MNVWCKNEQKSGYFDKLGIKQFPCQSTRLGSPELFIMLYSSYYIPVTKVSNTCGSNLSLYSDKEYLPLKRAQSYSNARSYMA